jgi:hypothetical protein
MNPDLNNYMAKAHIQELRRRAGHRREMPQRLVRLRASAFADGRSLREVARDVLAHRLRLEASP